MSEMVEVVAKALFHALFPWADWDKGANPPTLGIDHKEAWRKQARAAIAAMREPTKAMIDAGETAKDNAIDRDRDSRSGTSYTSIRSDIHEAIWSAMIDAALADG